MDEIETLLDLAKPEHLLVWAFRAMAVGQADCPLVARTFQAACGSRGGDALAAYFTLVRYIGTLGRRRLQVHVPGCLCVSRDELAVVGVIAAAQSSIVDGDETLLKMRLQFLIESTASENIVFYAQLVARALNAQGHRLPLRLDEAGPAPVAGERPRLVH